MKMQTHHRNLKLCVFFSMESHLFELLRFIFHFEIPMKLRKPLYIRTHQMFLCYSYFEFKKTELPKSIFLDQKVVCCLRVCIYVYEIR